MKPRNVIAAVLAIYVIGYAVFRATNSEVWDKDGRTYVIYPTGTGVVLYYVWRPLAYVDNYLTNTGAHIGPHQE
jgi:hypothetical protein